MLSPRSRTLACAVLVGAIAWAQFFMWREHPRTPFWDENYYVTSAQRYLEGTAQFSVHPPLGLMLIAAGEALLGDNRELQLQNVAAQKRVSGKELPSGYSFRGVRLFPAMFAAASAVLFFAILLRLTQRRMVALAFSCLYLFENAFIAHLSAAHLDAFLVFFALGAVLCAILRVQSPLSPNRWVITLFGACIGLAAMVKVSGLLLAVLAFWMIRKPASTEGPGGLTGTWRLDLGAASRILFGMLSVMVMVMTAHALMSHQPPDPMSRAGHKDLPFISQTHLDYLRGSAELTPTVLVHVTADYVRFMHAEHEGIPQGGPGTSRALLWPLHVGTINYRWDKSGDKTRYVQLAGNVVNWAVGLAALTFCALLSSFRGLRSSSAAGEDEHLEVMKMLLVAYLVQMAFHLWLEAERAVYLYHYFVPLLLTYTMAPLAWRRVAEGLHIGQTAGKVGLLVLVAASVAMSSFIWPLNRHEPLTKTECEKRNFLMTMVKCRK